MDGTAARRAPGRISTLETRIYRSLQLSGTTYTLLCAISGRPSRPQGGRASTRWARPPPTPHLRAYAAGCRARSPTGAAAVGSKAAKPMGQRHVRVAAGK